jgi:hypothetical protein
MVGLPVAEPDELARTLGEKALWAEANWLGSTPTVATVAAMINDRTRSREIHLRVNTSFLLSSHRSRFSR